MTDLVEHALDYARRGWSILPTKDKRPALRTWKRYQTERAPESMLRRWFKRNGVTGLAVVCGPVSGGLVVRDFDDIGAYERWASENPELATRLPTVETGRGRHVYFRASVERVIPVQLNGKDGNIWKHLGSERI